MPCHYLTQYSYIVNWPLGASFSKILIKIHTFSCKKMHSKMSSVKWQPFVSATTCKEWQSFLAGIGNCSRIYILSKALYPKVFHSYLGANSSHEKQSPGSIQPSNGRVGWIILRSYRFSMHIRSLLTSVLCIWDHRLEVLDDLTNMLPYIRLSLSHSMWTPFMNGNCKILICILITVNVVYEEATGKKTFSSHYCMFDIWRPFC